MSEPLRFRNARGEWVAVESVPAARLKNEPATVIDRVVAGGAVAITRHDKPRAVLVSYEDFRELAAAREASLGALSQEFDRLLEGMQAPGSRKATTAAFESPGDGIGRNAVKAARPRLQVAAKRVARRARKAGGRR
jgi:prevent-host-death family protein